MKKKYAEVEKEQEESSLDKKITRKQALKKAGLMAVSATTMMVMLNNNGHAMVKPKHGGHKFRPTRHDPKTSPGRD